MNRTLLCLAGLLLATPSSAQVDPSQGSHAAELLRQSAEQAAAGHETAAADLAQAAMELLRTHEERARERFVVVQDHRGLQFRGWQLPEGAIEMKIVSAHPESRSMPQDDLQHQLRAIHHELEQLRHELHALRAEMHGGGDMDMDMDMGMWVPQGNMPHSDRMHIMRMPMGQMGQMGQMGPGNMQFGLSPDFGNQIRDEVMRSLSQNGMDFFFSWDSDGPQRDEDYDFPFPEGMERHSQIKVIINGETFEGDAARRKLEELGGNESGGWMRMLHLNVPETSEPMEPRRLGSWRRSGDRDQEEL